MRVAEEGCTPKDKAWSRRGRRRHAWTLLFTSKATKLERTIGCRRTSRNVFSPAFVWRWAARCRTGDPGEIRTPDPQIRSLSKWDVRGFRALSQIGIPLKS